MLQIDREISRAAAAGSGGLGGSCDISAVHPSAGSLTAARPVPNFSSTSDHRLQKQRRNTDPLHRVVCQRSISSCNSTVSTTPPTPDPTVLPPKGRDKITCYGGRFLSSHYGNHQEKRAPAETCYSQESQPFE